MRRIKNLVGIMCWLLILALGITVQAAEVKKHGKGLELEERESEQESPKVTDVRLNEQAIQNILNYGENVTKQDVEGITTVEKGKEFVTEQDITGHSNERSIQLQAEDALIEDIKVYDGSDSYHFPPIGDQGDSGSCVAWSMGYYQLTNNIANVRGLDAKHNIRYRISPSWIYNLTKRRDYDKNAGTTEYETSALLLKQGAPFWSDFSGETTATNFKSWNPDVVIWEKALQNRVDERRIISVIDSAKNQLDLNELKRTLLDGYVVSFGLNFDEYLIYKNRIKYPESNKNDAILTANKITSNSGGHEMTIVGWNDTLKIDIDGDGSIDSEGALKIANSWGTGTTWNNDAGYFWLAYDAILSQSKVASANIKRIQAIDYNEVCCLIPKITYKPLMLLELTLKTDSRRQLAVRLGTSSINQSKPKSYKFIFDKPYQSINEESVIFAFKNYQNKIENILVNYDFYGNETNKKEAKFIFDLTDTIADYYGDQSQFKSNQDVNFYIQIEDKEKDGYGSSLRAVRIIDRVNNSNFPHRLVC